MRIQLDTSSKTIKVEGTVNIEDLYETLKKLLPRGDWKLFALEANTTIEWVNPIVVPRYPYYPQYPYPWWGNPTSGSYCNSGNYETQGYTNALTYELKEGVYNIEV